MIDKAEQRRRAVEMSQTLAAQGLEKPKLTYPVAPKPAIPVKSPKGMKLDCAGKQLYVGDTVATVVDGIVSILRIGKIVRMTKDRVEVEIVLVVNGRPQYSQTILKYPQAVAKIV